MKNLALALLFSIGLSGQNNVFGENIEKNNYPEFEVEKNKVTENKV